jgi:hypothetical protein
VRTILKYHMNLPGFTPGEKAQNAVVAAMYFVALAAIVAVAATFIGIPGVGGGNTTQVTPQAPAASGDQTQSQPQDQSGSSGWVTVTSSGDSGSSESESTDSAPPTQLINEKQVKLRLVRNAMENNSKVELVSADIRQNELYVRYTQDNMSRAEIPSGAGAVAGTYLGLVGSGSDLEAINGRLVDGSGQVAYTFTLERDIMVRYNNNRMSDSELRQRIVDAIQPANQSSGPTTVT